MKDKDLYVKDARSGNLTVPSSHKTYGELSQRKPCNKYIITPNLINPTPPNLKSITILFARGKDLVQKCYSQGRIAK